MTSAPALREAVHAVSPRVLILDVTEVPFVDSSAIGVLVHIYISCRDSGRKLALVGPTERVRKTLRFMSVEKLFNIFATVSEAETAFA